MTERDRRLLVVAVAGVAVVAEWDAGGVAGKANVCAERCEPAGAIERRQSRTFRELRRPDRKCSAL